MSKYIRTTAEGDIIHYFDDKIHREDGPAIITHDGNKMWILNGEFHREDGPAFEGSDGCKKWWFKGKQTHCETQEEFERLIKLKALW